MSLIYDLFMKPLEDKLLKGIRAQIMPAAYGMVLEVGVGTGVNLQYYQWDQIDHYTSLDIDALGLTIKAVPKDRVVDHHMGSVCALPFEDGSFDTVIETLVLCSVENLDLAITEMLRVLKPGGQLIFIDHVAPETPFLNRVFQAIDNVWPHIAGGCHVTRMPHKVIAGRAIQWIIDGRDNSSLFKYGVVLKDSLHV